MPLRFLNTHRIFFYSAVSFISVCAVVSNGLKNHSNFYSVAIHLSMSSKSVLVLANFGILLSLVGGHMVQRLFFGALRPNEVERLYDRLWFFITESLLAFTIFRDEFDTSFGLMFGFLLFIKSFHWLASDRIEWMDQRPYPGPPLIFHFRMVFLFAILWATDVIVFLLAVEHTLSNGVGGMVLFASEYGILVASLMNTFLKYCLSTYDLRRAGRRGGENAPPWENKSMWTFYIELMTDFLKLSTYLVFFCIIIAFYGLPLNIVRDVYITARSFITRLKALHRYQTATRNMDQRYPNATEEELSAMSDRTCIICREEMVSTAVQPNTQEPNTQADGPNMTPKKLPCGHIFHFQCLRSWLERQQSCPTCRRNVLDETNETRVPAAAAAVDQGAGNLPQNALGPQPAARPNAQERNNPLGFLGRFFGVGNPAQGNNVNGRQPGIFINYQVQYQFPRRQNENNLQDEQLQPPPPFGGFHGPGGEWQPWQAPQPQLQPTPTSTPVETPRADGFAAAEAQPSSTSQDTSQSVQEQGDIPSAREAARQAALRRFGEQEDTNSQAEASTSKSIQQEATTPTPTPTPPVSLSTSTSGPRIPPQLIPLFDFRDFGGALHPSSASVAVTHVGDNSRSIPAQIMVPSTHGQDSMATTPASSRVPRRLTEDQLARLDTLTRESIDLRLRILDGVSATLTECIDDLMELRSALAPLEPTPSTTGASGSPSPLLMAASAGGKQEENCADDKGKGKEKASDVSASSEVIGLQPIEQVVDY